MSLTSARFTKSDDSQVNMVHDTGSSELTEYPPVKLSTEDLLLAEFEDNGGVITTYDPYFGWTVEQAKAKKKEQIGEKTAWLVYDANNEPWVGADPSVGSFAKRTADDRALRGDKVALGIALTADELAKGNVDLEMTMFTSNCWSANADAYLLVDAETDVTTIMSLDVDTMVAWPVWTPPVL